MADASARLSFRQPCPSPLFVCTSRVSVVTTPLSSPCNALLCLPLLALARRHCHLAFVDSKQSITMDADDLDHLSPDFDPTSVTIPRLRSILLAHDVDYSASSKKADLVRLFEDHVAPQARTILKSRSRVKPSAAGITDAQSSRASSVHDAQDAERVAMSVEGVTPRATRRSASRASGYSSRASADPPSRASTADATDRRRRTRTSAVVPPIKEESVDVDAAEDTPFSPDNPFQSGSSPLSDQAATAAASRRRTPGRSSRGPSGNRNELEARYTGRRTSRPRSSAAAEESDRFTPFSEAGSDLVEGSDEDEDLEDPEDSEAGEEFTPEEQYELDHADAHEVARRPAKARRKPTSALSRAPWAVLLAFLGGFATVWRQEKLNVGYCGVGRPSTSLGGVEIPEWASVLRPECEVCPQHAYCFEALQTTCEPDFVLKPHPLSINGLVPLAPTCEPDGEKARRVKAVADRAINELRERAAHWECGELREGNSADLAEAELKAVVAKGRRKGMSQDEFEELWTSAIGEIIGRDEVSVDADG